MMDDLVADMAAVFYNGDDFGVRCVLRRTGQEQREFVALLGEQSDDFADDHLRGRRRDLSCPASVGLRTGDRVEVLDGPMVGHYRAEGVEVGNDGLELSAVLLQSAAGPQP